MNKNAEQLLAVQAKISKLEETRKNMERKLANLQDELIINQAELIKLRRQEQLLASKVNNDTNKEQ